MPGIKKQIAEAEDHWELWQIENYGDVLEKSEIQEGLEDKQRSMSNSAYLSKLESEFGRSSQYHPRSIGHYND